MTLGAIRSTGLTASRALAEWTAEKLFPNDSHQEQNEPVMPPPGVQILCLLPDQEFFFVVLSSSTRWFDQRYLASVLST